MRLWRRKPTKNDGQRDVIDAPVSRRMVVEGGPGTGKTATACARVARLIDSQSVDPSAILVVSFTRIAVREIGERVALALKDRAAAQAVAIVTLDSLAAFLSPEAEESESHDDSIRFLIPQLPLCPALRGLRHVIVDEAHDVVGLRADLVEAMFRVLPDACGATVFADSAQSIYDFADRSRRPKPSLPARLVEAGMPVATLSVLYRTANPALTDLFEQSRPVVLSERLSPAGKLKKLSRMLEKAAAEIDALPFAELADSDNDDTLILFRYRADVLTASTKLAERGIGHRLRMSGLPSALPAWIGLTLARQDGASLGRSRFIAAWDRYVAGTDHAIVNADEAWARLYLAAPSGGEICLPSLRRKLMQASPPLDLCLPQLGTAGPVVGTIHASKGREAEHVILAVPNALHPAADGQECRVLFVGATRAKQGMRRLRHDPEKTGAFPSGRLWRDGDPFMLELGMAEDIAASGLLGPPAFANAQQVEAAQDFWAGLPPRPTSFLIDEKLNMIFENHIVARLSSSIDHDLATLNPPRLGPFRSGRIWTLGVRTIVFAPDEHPALIAPWRDSGFALAPIVAGYGILRFEETTRGSSKFLAPLV